MIHDMYLILETSEPRVKDRYSRPSHTMGEVHHVVLHLKPVGDIAATKHFGHLVLQITNGFYFRKPVLSSLRCAKASKSSFISA